MSLSKILRSILLSLLVITPLLGNRMSTKTVIAAEAAFTTKTVDAGRTPYLTLDPGGSPKIAYCFLVDPSGAANTYQLRYAEQVDLYNPSDDWTSVIVETLPVNTACADTSLQIDSAGAIHIAYFNPGRQQLPDQACRETQRLQHMDDSDSGLEQHQSLPIPLSGSYSERVTPNCLF